MVQIDNGQSNDIDFLLNNIFITGVSGRLGDRVFYTRNGKIRSRRNIIPSNPRTRKQQAGRSRFADAVRAWRMLHAEARADWRRRAARYRRIGYNFFISEYLAGAVDTALYMAKPAETVRPKRRVVRMVISSVKMREYCFREEMGVSIRGDPCKYKEAVRFEQPLSASGRCSLSFTAALQPPWLPVRPPARPLSGWSGPPAGLSLSRHVPRRCCRAC